MELPLTLVNKLNQASQLLHSNTEYQIKPVTRLNIYAVFDLFEGKLARIWFTRLEILTAKRVLPIWQEALPNNQLPEQILDLAEQVLNGSLDFEIARNASALDELYQLLGGDLEDEVPATVEFAGEAAYCAFVNIRHQPFQNLLVDEKLTDDKFYSQLGGDAASSAVKAFAGVLMDGYWVKKSDPQKRLEFWEWWLTEAIPQAWDLAQSSYKPDQHQ